jgi:hypothetical protein
VLKNFKGNYILSTRYSGNAWWVAKISLKDGVLAMGTIPDGEGLQKLREITETTADTTTTHFALKRRQFKAFVKQDGFGEQETFKRMRGNNL